MTNLTGIRPSLGARCATAAVFQGRGEIPADPPPEVEEFFNRGRWMEAMIVARLRKKHGAENVKTQVVIPIPGIGEGHMDALVNDTLAVEIVSTVAPLPNAPIFDYKLAQLRRYMHFGGYDEGAVIAVNPSRYEPEQTFAVRITDEDREEIEEWRTYIVEGVNGGEIHLNERGTDLRPCTKPSQARGRMCPFSSVCFDGWEPPDAGAIDDPEVLNAASELAAIVEQERVHKAAIAALDETKRALKQALADVLPEKGETTVGPFVLKTWPVRGKVTVQAKALEAAGIDPYPFATVGDPRVEVRVELAEQAGEVDYGTEAPF